MLMTMSLTAHSIGKNLDRMAVLNPRLATELSKLPELRTFKTAGAGLALDNLLEIYRFAPRRFTRLFRHMDVEGLAHGRNYCTPLQALFWLIQDEKMSSTGMVLGLDIDTGRDNTGHCRPHLVSGRDRPRNGPDPPYDLKKILDMAWNGEARSLLFTNVHTVIDQMRPGKTARDYADLKKRRTDLQLTGYIMDDFATKNDLFHAGDREMIQQALDHSRWKLFYTVADRLNSPELVNYYINKQFFFRKTPSSGVYFTFRDKKAQCTDAAYFTRFMLDRAGYKTFMRSVKWDEDPWDGLHTGAGIILDNGDFLLVSNYTGINALAGPFKTLESLDQKIGQGRKIIDRRWGAYFPPRYY